MNIDTHVLGPGVYQLKSIALVNQLLEPSWWSEWNGSESIVSQSDGGAKTLNLHSFLKRLQDATIQIANQQIGTFCHVLQRD